MKKEKLVSKVPEYSIIISHELTPGDTILFSKREIQGYATDKGGMTSHAAIISRALNIPAVVGMKDISVSLKTGDFIIIDGINGLVIKNPKEELVEEYKRRLDELKLHESQLKEQINLPTRTADGKDIDLSVNIEFDEEINFVVNTARCGVGLYRTEHLFLEAGDFPPEDRQIEEYTHIANMTYPNPVTIRTYDIGGDKLLPRSEKEDNPFLGWRGIRICLDRVEIFKEQLSALLRSSGKGNVRIMFPMISSVTEVLKAKEILNEVKDELDAKGISYDKSIKVGIMIEVPSAYFLADELAREVDFFSIGTNDLIQYLLAVDRGNQYISGLFQQFHPAVLRAIKSIVDAGNRNGIPVSICGEMASKPVAAAVLLGLGINELSVVPSVFAEIKQIIRKMDYAKAAELANGLLLLSSEAEISEAVKNFSAEFALVNT
jgi:phosphotransferase system enzyme I (PtsI)